MGIFWDLLQQDEIDKHKAKAASLDERVGVLEAELEKTHILLRKTLEALETHIGADIDGDGRQGA